MEKLKYSQNGITIVALIITIIVLLILASVTYSTGRSAITNAQLTTFSTEMQIMQTEVNGLYQKYRQGDTTVLNIGEDLQGTAEEETAFAGAVITDTSGYRYYTADTLYDELELEDIDQEFLVNVSTRSVISLIGFEYDGTTYYTVEQIPDSLYNVGYSEVTGSVSFNLSYTSSGTAYKLNLTNITYEANVAKGTIYYGQENNGQINWKTAVSNTVSSSYSIDVTRTGTWYVKIIDAAGNESDVKNVTIDTAQVTVPDANYSITNSGIKTYYATLAEAHEAAVDGNTIVVEKNVEDSSTVTITKNIILDNNSKTLTKTTTGITINEGATFEITGDGTITTATMNRIIDNYGTLNITHIGTISSTYTGTGNIVANRERCNYK